MVSRRRVRTKKRAKARGMRNRSTLRRKSSSSQIGGMIINGVTPVTLTINIDYNGSLGVKYGPLNENLKIQTDDILDGDFRGYPILICRVTTNSVFRTALGDSVNYLELEIPDSTDTIKGSLIVTKFNDTNCSGVFHFKSLLKPLKAEWDRSRTTIQIPVECSYYETVPPIEKYFNRAAPESIQTPAVQQLIDITKMDDSQARYYLRLAGDDVNAAATLYFESGSQGAPPIQPAPSQDYASSDDEEKPTQEDIESLEAAYSLAEYDGSIFEILESGFTLSQIQEAIKILINKGITRDEITKDRVLETIFEKINRN